MPIRHSRSGAAAALVALLLATSCVGGGDGGAFLPRVPTPPAEPPPVVANYVHLHSEVGDYVGAGRDYTYTQADAEISLVATGGHLSVTIQGDESWTGDFQEPSGVTSLQPGTYADLRRYPFHLPAQGGMSWSGEGRGCNTLAGSFTVESVTYLGDQLTSIDLSFEQHCEGGASALHGEIHWTSTDTTAPPGPVTPPPGLWDPGVVVTAGNYVHLESDPGDYIGAGGTYTYTQSNAVLFVVADGGRLSVGVTGDEYWHGDFQTMGGVSQLQPGYYGNVQRYPFHNPVRGGLDWWGQGRGCNTLTGWVVVDAVTYSGPTLTAVDLRFEQHCEGGAPALHGKIHWTSTDTTAPPGPVTPPPGLWDPGAVVTSGSYVHLESDPGDYIGAGRTYTYTKTTAFLSVSAIDGHLSIAVTGDEVWHGDFQTPTGVSLQPGYYANLQRYPFHNPSRGGLDWSGEGRGCNTLTGWVVVDAVTYSGPTLTDIDLRFEQHCEGGAPALHGRIHWTSTDTTAPSGPVTPPAGLWDPGAVVTGGNYVHLESDAGDYIGAGGTYTYTQSTAVLSVSATGGHLSVGVTGDERWHGYFQTMSGVQQLQPGYYANLQRYPFHNPVRGGLSWSGEGRGCNTLTGWVVVDAVTYSGETLTAIDLRFEQHCEGGSPALHGKVHWAAGDTTAPPGPVTPPAGLWDPGAVVTGGNYVHLESDAGDYIGAGGTYTYTQATAQLSVSGTGGHLSVGVNGDEAWQGDFNAMSSLTQLQPGYYGDLQRSPFHNPARGGLAWYGEGRGCNTLTGWFVVDAVTYSGSTLTAIDVRFEQRCEGGSPALHGKIHWAAGDVTAPPGPVTPPAGLWDPGAVVTSGSYVHLESDAGDYIGAGATYTYTQPTSTISVGASGGHLSVNVSGWYGHFQTMSGLTQLQPGYYGDLQRYPFHNPVRGGLDWYGQGRGCNTLTGWFVVDAVTYSGPTLTAIDLRFEQRCEGGSPALHGKIHWAP